MSNRIIPSAYIAKSPTTEQEQLDLHLFSRDGQLLLVSLMEMKNSDLG
jgi:hypothetical protein